MKEKDSKFLIFSVIFTLIFLAALFVFPKDFEAPPYLKIEHVEIVDRLQNQTTIELTISWRARSLLNCYIANDIRPAGAPLGEPETDEWNQNHLIRYSIEPEGTMRQLWINAQTIKKTQDVQSFRYIIENPGGNEVDIYSSLKCEDVQLAFEKTSMAI